MVTVGELKEALSDYDDLVEIKIVVIGNVAAIKTKDDVFIELFETQPGKYLDDIKDR